MEIVLADLLPILRDIAGSSLGEGARHRVTAALDAFEAKHAAVKTVITDVEGFLKPGGTS